MTPRHIHGKLIAIKDLPHCMAKELLSSIASDESKEVWVVAKEGTIGDWASYIGWPSLVDMRSDLQNIPDYIYYATQVHDEMDVVALGDKLDEETAHTLFPDWSDKPYRP